MVANSNTHTPVFREINIDTQPLTSSQKKIKRKQNLKDLIKNKLEKQLEKIQKRCENEKLLINVKFRVMESEEKGRSKTDLDNLLKILLDVLSKNMVNGQDPIPGVGIVQNDSQIYEIRCKKLPVLSPEKEGIDLQISIMNKTSFYSPL